MVLRIIYFVEHCSLHDELNPLFWGTPGGFQTVTPLWRNRALLQQTIESRKRTLWGCCQSKLPDDDHKLDGPCSSVA